LWRIYDLPLCNNGNLGDSHDEPATMSQPATQPFIQLRDVSKYFDKFCALDAVSLDIELGQKLVICGPSGSGKSTLIRCINRLERYEAGEIRIDDIVVDDSPTGRAVLRNNVGMVFQQFNLFPHLTILENLMLGPVRARKMAEAEARDLAMHYLERVRIPEQFSKYPAQLSGGQQQRVAIARALCMAPKIMLFDEPTSALDPEMIAEVLDVIEELADSGMTMICVTHEMGFARQVADMMLFMDHGKIVEMGPPKTFFTAPESDRCKLFLSQILRH
jgi:ABC-type polar amino acid transport system ATPase subunit